MRIGFTIALVAAALSVAGLPAFAAEMPVYGTKNFTPGSDTPTYFTHNPAAPTVRSEDWSAADQAAGPSGSIAAPAHASDAAVARHHGKVATSHRGGSHSAGKSKGKSRTNRTAAAKPGKVTRTASAAHNRPAASAGKTRSAGHATHGTRHAAAKSSQRKG